MQIWLWSGFLVLVAIILAIDLGVIVRKAHAMSGTSAMRWIGVFITLDTLFAGVVYSLDHANIDAAGQVDARGPLVHDRYSDVGHDAADNPANDDAGQFGEEGSLEQDRRA